MLCVLLGLRVSVGTGASEVTGLEPLEGSPMRGIQEGTLTGVAWILLLPGFSTAHQSPQGSRCLCWGPSQHRCLQRKHPTSKHSGGKRRKLPGFLQAVSRLSQGHLGSVVRGSAVPRPLQTQGGKKQQHRNPHLVMGDGKVPLQTSTWDEK